jgi:hypothetical protein
VRLVTCRRRQAIQRFWPLNIFIFVLVNFRVSTVLLEKIASNLAQHTKIHRKRPTRSKVIASYKNSSQTTNSFIRDRVFKFGHSGVKARVKDRNNIRDDGYCQSKIQLCTNGLNRVDAEVLASGSRPAPAIRVTRQDDSRAAPAIRVICLFSGGRTTPAIRVVCLFGLEADLHS